MNDSIELPAGLRRWPNSSRETRPYAGFEFSLLDDCDNAYRFTVMTSGYRIPALLKKFSRFLPDDAFFILEYYPDESLLARPAEGEKLPDPAVFYSPYLPTSLILDTVTPFLERMIHDGFVGFGLANNRLGLEFFFSEEKVLTLFTDNHLRLCHFLQRQGLPYRDEGLVIPADFGHDHLSLLGFPRNRLPAALSGLSNAELDATLFCQTLIDELEMYQVEEGLSFFLTRKEQEQINAVIKNHLGHLDLLETEFGGLLLDWSDFVTECEQSFDGDLQEYREGLQIRDTIQLVIEAAPSPLADKIRSIVAEADRNFHTNLVDRRKRLDSPAGIKLPQESSWYQGVVRNQGTDLRRDLIRHGWFKR